MKSFYIIHEGCTEEHYMNHLLTTLGMPPSSLRMQFHNFNGGGAVNAFRKFKSLIDDSSHSHIDHYLIILDNDVPKIPETKTSIFNYAPTGKQVTFVTFEPCMEGFLIAHFEDNYHSTTYQSCIQKNIDSTKSLCAQCGIHLKSHHLPNYGKNNCTLSFLENIKKDEFKMALKNIQAFQNIMTFIRSVA